MSTELDNNLTETMAGTTSQETIIKEGGPKDRYLGKTSFNSTRLTKEFDSNPTMIK